MIMSKTYQVPCCWQVYTWANETYNQGYKELGKENVIRPVLFPPKGEIGGHCVVPNFNLRLSSWLLDVR